MSHVYLDFSYSDTSWKVLDLLMCRKRYIHTYIWDLYCAWSKIFKAHDKKRYITNLHYNLRPTMKKQKGIKPENLIMGKQVWFEERLKTRKCGSLTNVLRKSILKLRTNNCKRLVPETAFCMWNVKPGTITWGTKLPWSSIYGGEKVNFIL